MDPDGSIISRIILLLVLVACCAFFTVSEIAIISLSDSKLRKQAQEGDKRANLLVKLTNEPSRFLATIQLGVTLCGLFAAAVAANSFSWVIAGALAVLPLSQAAVHGVTTVVITLALAYVLMVFGRIVPKRAAMQNYERIAYATARLISLLAAVFRPFVALLSATSGAVLRLMGIDPDRKPEEVTEEEIRMMIDVGGESGTIEQAEKDMLNNIFEFDDTTAEDMMTHRTEITAIELGTPLDEIIALARESGHSRIPVYKEDLDSIVGVLYVKDLLGLITGGEEQRNFDLAQYMREPLYVLETTKSATLLGEFKVKKIQIAIVVDEYGGTSGLVTMEDLLEEIVGSIQDEYDDEEEDIAPVGENRYLVDGLAPLDDVLKFFTIEMEDEDEYDTIGGYIISELGYIPAEDDHPDLVLDDVRFTVQQMDERRIEKLLAEVLSAPETVEQAASMEA